jgi:2'-hydroxyisoflavone reductase
MTTTRRDFLRAGLGGLAAAPALAGAAPAPRDTPAGARTRAARPLTVLALGGTGFLGRHVVDALLARGHVPTIFNRGRTSPLLFPEVERLRGDRDGDLDALRGRDWDAVVDTSGYVPRVVRDSARLLAEGTRQYVFVSSVSAYASFEAPSVDETTPLATIADASVEDVSEGNYGALKVLCEREAEAAMPGRVTVVRPGLIVGAYDNVPRFTYWPVRVARGGEVLAPGAPDDPVQYVDGRDLAAFIVRCIEQRTVGTFNVTGPTTPTTIAELLYGCKAVTGPDVTFTWVDAAFLAARGVEGWNDVPVWAAPTGALRGLHRVKVDRAKAAGLTTRPLADTVRDTLAWWEGLAPQDRPPISARMDDARERTILNAWRGR